MPRSKTRKRYPTNQSALYAIRGMRRLEQLLGIQVAQLREILSSSNYRVWFNERGREIQHPIGPLGRVHARIANLLAPIELPDYVFSQKGRSYVDNARQHLGNVPVGKTDISGFFPSTTRAMVWGMFLHQFKCAPDVADVLADLCCYQQKHLPTGSTLSGTVAYLASREMFDEIHRVAANAGNRMTLYVDDVTLSGSTVTKRLLAQVGRVVRQHGHKIKQAKTKTFAATKPKTVTGAVIVGENLKLPNSRHKRIKETRVAIRSAAGDDRKALVNALGGRLQDARQILSVPSQAEQRLAAPITKPSRSE